jgi:hypothetical protein
MITLTDKQNKEIERFISIFKEYTDGPDYKEDLAYRKERELFFSKITKQTIEGMTEFEFGEIISKLWATQIWGNKQYLIQKLISDNGFETLKTALKNLFFDSKPIEERYDAFARQIKGIGPAGMTELLCLINPKENGIWNDKARKALSILGFEKELPLEKYKITGKEYAKFNDALGAIAEKLKKAGYNEADLLFVDYFLYEIRPVESIPIAARNELPKEKLDHDEIRDYIRDIGNSLGFEAEIEVRVGSGARVDAVWTAKIANLGVVMYVFEVQSGGSIDSLLLNLQKAKRNQSVQKLIAVSDAVQLEKIKNEVKDLPEDFRKSMSFWDSAEVKQTYQNLSEVMKNIDKLNLIKSAFEESVPK